jgi:hypothetical protein
MAEVSDPGIMRAMRIVNTSLYPMTFNPATQELLVYHNFTVELTYHGTNTINPLLNGYPSMVDSLSAAMYKSLIINYDWLGILSGSSVFAEYVVITANEYYDDLEDFVFWKHKKGCKVKVVIPSDIVGRDYFVQEDTAAIRNYLKDTFGSAERVAYVLLVGDENAVPMFNEWQSHNELIYSDHYYACINGNDDYPDLAIGRFSVADNNDVITIINKIFAYERTPAQDWGIRRVLMVSHWCEDCYHNTNQWIINNVLSLKGFYCYDAYGEIGLWDNALLQECIENTGPEEFGVSIVNYHGHGQPDSWFEWNVHGESYTTTDVHNLTNTNHYPIVYNCCCLNGAVQETYEVMVEAWTRDPDGGGVGALGASRESWKITYDPIPKDLFIATFEKDIFDVGFALNYAKSILIQEHGGIGLQNARMYNWFGDPELSIWTCPLGCSTMIVTHPARITTNPTSFTVTVKDIEGGPVVWAAVCLYKIESPEFWQTRFTGTDGKAIFTIDPVSPGMLYVTVTKQNYAPYEGTCQVIESGGPQSRESISSIPINYDLNRNVPNPFYGSTVIPYQIPIEGDMHSISIKIYDITGTYMRTLVDQPQRVGYHTVVWDGTDDSGKKVPSGVYFVRFESNNYCATRKLLMLK